MNDSNKIDLKDINKKDISKKLSFPKFKNPFKKQSGPLRDEEGKFAATIGSGGLRGANKKLDLKRALPLIVVITLAGGFLVYSSFASGSRAEVTKWYRTCLNAEPDSGGLNFWAGRLDKGEAMWAVADAFMKEIGKTSCPYPNAPKTSATPKPPAAPVPATAGGGSTGGSGGGGATNTTHLNTVKAWYKACGRQGKQADWNYWAGDIVARTQALAWNRFKTAIEGDGSKCPSSDPTITTTGGSGTTTTSSNPLQDAQAWVTLGATHVANAKKENGTTYQVSLKNPIAGSDLSFIAQKEGYVRGALSQMQTGKGKVQGLYNSAVSNAATRSQGSAILQAVNEVQAHINSLSAYANNIANDYKRAEATYHANLSLFGRVSERTRNERDCKARGGNFNPWSGWAGKCTFPKPRGATHGNLAGTGSNGGSGPAQPQDTRPAFVRPMEKCADSYIPVPGNIIVEWRWGESGAYQTSRIDAVTCHTPSPARQQGYNVTKAYDVCPGGYTARRINKTFHAASRSPLPPNGWVCFRGEADWLRR